MSVESEGPDPEQSVERPDGASEGGSASEQDSASAGGSASAAEDRGVEEQAPGAPEAPQPAPGDEPVSAERRPGLGWIVVRLSVVAVLVGIDLWTKHAVFAWLEGPAAEDLVRNCCDRGHKRLMVLGDGVTWFSFMLSENRGAAFGGFADYPHLLVGGRVLAGLFLLWLVIRAPLQRRWFTLALMLVLAGALGNLWDNIYREHVGGHPYGRVRDFIDVYFASFGDYHFPTFNFADSCITVGAVLLLLSGLGGEREKRQPAVAGEQPASAG